MMLSITRHIKTINCFGLLGGPRIFLLVCLTALTAACVPKVQGLLVEMGTGDKKVHDDALARLLRLEDKAVPDLLVAAEDENLRTDACFVLAMIGSPAISPLARRLARGELAQRKDAALVLGMMMETRGIPETDREVVINALLAALADRNNAVRLEAFDALCRIGPDAFPWLVGGLSSDHPKIRAGCAAAISRLGPGAEQATSYIVPLLKDRESEVRIEAARALGEIASQPETVLPALLDAAHSENEDERKTAIIAMARFGKPSVPYLSNALFDQDPEIRVDAARGLAALKIGETVAIPALVKAVCQGDAKLRQAAAEALEAFGVNAINSLGEVLADKSNDAKARALAARTIGKLGAGGRAVIHNMVPALEDADSGVRFETAVALARVFPKVQRAVEVILEQLGEVDTVKQVEGLAALGAFTEQADRILPGLLPWREHSNPDVRKAADDAAKALSSKK
ncbi:MAG: HEAT repeat domain-containing protein [Deltaproteobacteria bacterium]|nr:HEAT repeat domain-containing protein [Deltaproteobacteria bacterium]